MHTRVRYVCVSVRADRTCNEQVVTVHCITLLSVYVYEVTSVEGTPASPRAFPRVIGPVSCSAHLQASPDWWPDDL